jgi:GH15 family glucan-1,4-alpha-glucosidase
MDLVSAARRLGKPFVFTSAGSFASLPLAARGIIGDGFTAALVAADGAIDWLCLPRFDSASVFARVLDAERGGSMAVRPATFPFESLQRYDPDTNVLETLFAAPGRGALRVVDLMPWDDDPRASIHELHRRVDCVDGEVEVEVVFDPRFDYARAPARVLPAEHGLMAEGPNGERLALSVSAKLAWSPLPAGGMRATITLRPGEQLWCVLSWGNGRVAHFLEHRPFEHLRVTRRKWREWSSRLTYDGP